MPRLTRQELETLGYWDRLAMLWANDPSSLNAESFDLSEPVMKMIRGHEPLPEWCQNKKENPLPDLAWHEEAHVIFDPSKTLPIANHVGPTFGPLLADSVRMLEALRLLSAEDLGGVIGYAVRDSAWESGDEWAGDPWDHPRLKSWQKACELTAELVKKHENFGK